MCKNERILLPYITMIIQVHVTTTAYRAKLSTEFNILTSLRWED